MSFIPRIVTSVLSKSRSILQLSASSPIVQKNRSIYSEEFLKIDKFRKIKHERHEKIYRLKNNFHEKLRDQVKTSLTSNELNFDVHNLHDLLHLCRKKQDLQLVIDGAKYLLENGNWPKTQLKGIGTDLMRLVYTLDDTKTGLVLLNDEKFEPLWGKCGYAYFILMNKLMEVKDYESVIKLFERQFPFFTTESSSSSKGVKSTKSKKIVTPIPYDQASLFLEALLLLNSKESFDKLKEYLKIFGEKSFSMNNLLIARSFLLAINQNDPEFALRLMYDVSFQNVDDSLARNLTIIALSRMNLLDEAFKMSKNLMHLRTKMINLSSDKSKFIGRYFPMTLKSLEEAVGRCGKAEHKVELEELESALEKDGDSMLQFDLKQYCKQEKALLK